MDVNLKLSGASLSLSLWQITSSQDIQTLGTLITGLPSTIISSISSAEILTASQSSAVVSNLITAPTIVQQTFVNQVSVCVCESVCARA